MRVVFLIGGIASGKSSVAAELEKLGAVRIDLDQLSRDVLAPGSPLLVAIAEEFGADLIEGGVLNRSLLAERAFATSEATARLEELELPAIKDLLVARIDALKASEEAPNCALVEVPLPDRMGPLMSLADEVLCVYCPVAIRRRRALGRGMTEEDFDRRSARQLSDEQMCALADIIFDNSGDARACMLQVHDWWAHNISR